MLASAGKASGGDGKQLVRCPVSAPPHYPSATRNYSNRCAFIVPMCPFQYFQTYFFEHQPFSRQILISMTTLKRHRLKHSDRSINRNHSARSDGSVVDITNSCGASRDIIVPGPSSSPCRCNGEMASYLHTVY